MTSGTGWISAVSLNIPTTYSVTGDEFFENSFSECKIVTSTLQFVLFFYIKPQLMKMFMFLSTVVIVFFSTSNHNYLSSNKLSILLLLFFFLHQTTTCELFTVYWLSCYCFFFYIKPQPFPWCYKGALVVIVFFSTSNHNAEFILYFYCKVVIVFFSTSNHNGRVSAYLLFLLLLFFFLHQTTTCSPCLVLPSRCYCFFFYIKPQQCV